MNKRLLRVARYLGSQGLYKEAAEIKKIASRGFPGEPSEKKLAKLYPNIPQELRLNAWYEDEAAREKAERQNDEDENVPAAGDTFESLGERARSLIEELLRESSGR